MITPRLADTRNARDERLDFFRGLAMFIIFVAHADINPLNNWIPAQFGFSSGAEVFVFCSGFASALAFGSVFLKRGFLLGTARVVHRIWQIYWAHLCSALVVIFLMATASGMFPSLHLDPLVPLATDPLGALLGLMSLRWLPGYLDILPMYIAMLAMLPLMATARKFHEGLPFVLSLSFYALVWTAGLNFTGNPWTGEGWYFNPFAWQLLFFSGFAFAMGWIPAPSLRDRRLLVLSVLFLGLSFPMAYWRVRMVWPDLQAWHDQLFSPREKTDLHILRVIHFFAVSYVALFLIDPIRRRLTSGAASVIVLVGQQSLAVFLASIVTARVASVVLQLAGTGVVVSTLVNATGFGIIIATARITRFFKSAPWRKPQLPKTPSLDGVIAALPDFNNGSLSEIAPTQR